jgi:hypothetical protein
MNKIHAYEKQIHKQTALQATKRAHAPELLDTEQKITKAFV